MDDTHTHIYIILTICVYVSHVGAPTWAVAPTWELRCFFLIVSVTSERDHRKCQHHLKTPKTSPRATAMAALKTLDLFPPPAAGQIFPQPGT